MARLSVVVLTRDEEAALPALLASVRDLADEVLVVDSGSTDRTVELAQAAGARVVSHAWEGYGPQRRFAAAEASHDLILSLDADERPDPELVAAIRAELARPENELAAGYRVHFRHRAFGRPARFGAMWRDVRLRLYDRRQGGYDASAVHERIHVTGPVRDLPGRCDHDGFRDPAEARAKLARYAELAARERHRRGVRWSPLDALRFPAGFLKRYLLRLGFLDGATGLTLALIFARYDADKGRWLRRLERELGGAHGRGPLASALRAVGRRAALGLALLFWPTPRRAMPPLTSIGRVLVVRTDERVGNQLLTTPLLRALRAGLPQAELHLLAAARKASVVPAGLLDRVVRFEKREAWRRPWRLVALLRGLVRTRYDVVVEAGHWTATSLTASLLARIAAGPRAAIVGHARGDSPVFLSHPVAHDPANANEVRAKLELLRPLGLLPRGLELETDLGRDPALAARALTAAGLGAGQPYAVLNPGARRSDRRWEPASYAAVARGLLDRGLAVLVVWGPGEEPLAQAIAAQSGARLAPPTDLEELASLLRGARLCVSNDSGPMHVAVAVQTPTVGVFLGSDARRWGHELPWFEAAVPRDERDAAEVLRACEAVLRRAAVA